MKTFLATLILAVYSLNSPGQKHQIDIDEIKGVAQSEKYEQLFHRFLINDTSLTINDYAIIYYGQAFKDTYQPNARHDSSRVLSKYLNRSLDSIDFKKVLNYTTLILNECPFNIEEIFLTGVAYNRLGVEDSARIWHFKYDNLIKTILSSGDGKTQETAFIVTKVSDEYSLINALGLRFAGQALVGKKNKFYDQMELAQNEFGLEKLYFDINLFFGLKNK